MNDWLLGIRIVYYELDIRFSVHLLHRQTQL